MSRILTVSCLVLALAVSGCASSTTTLKAPYSADIEDLNGPARWHQLRFRWHWPAQQPPAWHLDPMIADRVLASVITERRADIPLWRFHRRAGRDGVGHQFSFIFYGSTATAARVKAAVLGDPFTRDLMSRGVLEKVYVTEPDRPKRLSATSDSDWPQELQSAWPAFIMGVSQTWLALVEVYAGNDRPRRDLADEIRRYADVSVRLDEVWSENAQHAFFHHLSAVFGYRPMVMRKRLRF